MKTINKTVNTLMMLRYMTDDAHMKQELGKLAIQDLPLRLKKTRYFAQVRPNITASELATADNLSQNQASTELKQLYDAGLLVRAKNEQGHWAYITIEEYEKQAAR